MPESGRDRTQRTSRSRVALETGDVDAGLIWAGLIWAGQIQGLIHDVPTCADLVSRIVRDAEAIIRGRMTGMLAA